jgi:hypothetical protein
MRRLLLWLTVALVMAAMMAAMAVPAFASRDSRGPSEHNPNYFTAPVASPSPGSGGGCVSTYKAGTDRGSDAAHGGPGYVYNDAPSDNSSC